MEEKYPGMLINADVDNQVFKILVRTLKDFGYINKFSSLERIKECCYKSRYTNTNKGTLAETYFQNMLYWVKDIRDVHNTFNWVDERPKMAITMVFISRIVNSGVVPLDENNELVGRRFFNTFFDRLFNLGQYFNYIPRNKYWSVFDKDIMDSLEILMFNELLEKHMNYKFTIKDYLNKRDIAIKNGFFKPICSFKYANTL